MLARPLLSQPQRHPSSEAMTRCIPSCLASIMLFLGKAVLYRMHGADEGLHNWERRCSEAVDLASCCLQRKLVVLPREVQLDGGAEV